MLKNPPPLGVGSVKKKHGDWWERTTERKIENDQLPERLRNKIKPAEEVDIQDDIGELKNEV